MGARVYMYGEIGGWRSKRFVEREGRFNISVVGGSTVVAGTSRVELELS